MSDWANYRKNFPSNIVSAAKRIVEQDGTTGLRESFLKSIVPLINDNKKSDVVLALKDIIANDTSILPDTVVDKVTGLSKSALAATDTHVFEDFLAGVFLYVATVVANMEGKESVKNINKDYMSQFTNRAS